MAQRNPAARDLRDPRYRKQVVKPKKGKGSYDRRKQGGRSKGDRPDSFQLPGRE